MSKKSKQKILGEWLATWKHEGGGDSQDWIVEEVVAKKDFFRGIKFESLNNCKGLNWVGYGGIFEKRYLRGEWHSLNDAAYANGTFMFIISSRGNFMSGYETVPDDDGKLTFREFFLGRQPEDLERAKSWMKDR
ncbi:hypothetical protein J0656_18585 [Muricauda ruestringensis]|uniref:DUF4488 domain-containing protein n=1 Tax=Flagellimonas aurea TaxID=2915619 RepID=A0ABS3G9C5_9FLAO|nr:hypothetical protein [Allomuricauda aurea]